MEREQPVGDRTTGTATSTEIAVRSASGQADAAFIQSVYRPWVERTAASFEEVTPSVEDILARMEARPRLPWLIVEVDREAAGYAHASRHAPRTAYRWSADVSVYLKAEHRGRGLGRVLYERLIPEVRALGYVSLFAGITQPNPASVALHTALGFQLIGIHPNTGHKFGRWHDVGWYIQSPPNPPQSPVEPRDWASTIRTDVPIASSHDVS
ncbi:GNAT family N-acetyltransferase [Parafrankia sp. FMc2]|uniref:GNAT family N-acetyltransferase n=1 Tax=Parafrankia sp. FMc2 TaxID=3233196 RepID=UPI0034D40B38